MTSLYPSCRRHITARTMRTALRHRTLPSATSCLLARGISTQSTTSSTTTDDKKLTAQRMYNELRDKATDEKYKTLSSLVQECHNKIQHRITPSRFTPNEQQPLFNRQYPREHDAEQQHPQQQPRRHIHITHRCRAATQSTDTWKTSNTAAASDSTATIPSAASQQQKQSSQASQHDTTPMTPTAATSSSSKSTSTPPIGSRSPITWRAVVLLVISGSIGIALYEYEKDKKLHASLPHTSIGTPLLGGSFQLVDKHNRLVSSDDFKGQYMLIYFGFTNCPDICPAELEKMETAYQQFQTLAAKEKPAIRDALQLIFISIDPRRDTSERLQQYSRQWKLGDKIHWLTGSDEQIRDVAKKFRVYYSSPEWVDDKTHSSSARDEAYLVDHSIFFYLMDHDGDFMQYFAKNLSAQDVAMKTYQLIKEDNS